METRLAIGKLSDLLKAKRGKTGLRATAKQIEGVSASTLSRIEQGKMPDLDTFLKLCDWLETSPEQFFESQSKGETHSEKQWKILPDNLSTVEAIEVHLRADRELEPETAEALANMVKAAYNAIQAGSLGRKNNQG